MRVSIEDEDALAKIGAGIRGQERMRRALAAAVDQVKKDTENYVPKREGYLRKSVNTSRGEQGRISWDIRYASAVYHMPRRYHWTTPGTGPRWVETAATAGGFTKWQKAIQEVLEDG